jgi:hypothetical protein
MTRRLSASLSLLVFAVCLIAGMEAGNPLATVLSRGLTAMAGTMVVSLVVGTMAERMLEENLQRKERELREAEAALAADSPPAGGPAAAPGGAANKRLAK